MTRKIKPLIQLEQLEPRIMLSGDGLLNIAPNPHQDTILDNTSLTDQYAELLDTHEQVEEQISLEIAQSDTPNSYAYEPILTLLPDDDGGIGTATLQITVLDTLSAIDDLLSKVTNLDLSNGIESSLIAKVEAGIHLFGGDLGSDRSLMALLDAFIRGVNHWYEKDKLTGDAYNELLNNAELIRLDILSDI
jgi:hypothetical protein